MTTRPMRHDDISKLQAIAETSTFPYVDLQSIKVEAVYVAEDEDGNIIAATAAHRIIEIYGWVAKEHHPAVKLAALEALHDAMGRELRQRGYDEANAFLPPVIAKQFGRRLERSFGWVRNWASWALKF